MSFAIKIKDAISGRQYNFHGFDESEESGLYTVAGGVATPMAMPVSLKPVSEKYWWLLPWEPFVAITGGNVVAKRNVAKAKTFAGSIKERWTQDDWEITIEGIFTNAETNIYPREDIERFIQICQAKEPIEIKCTLLDAVGITKIVIEDYDLPFTKGPENQEWSIKAYSDRSWELLMPDNVLQP